MFVGPGPAYNCRLGCRPIVLLSNYICNKEGEIAGISAFSCGGFDENGFHIDFHCSVGN